MILERLGIELDVRPSDAAELEQGDPQAVACENALRKALAVPIAAGELVLGVDTIVALDGVIHGKPRDEQEAARTMRALSGKTHVVISGVALREQAGEPETHAALTSVTFRELDDDLIDWYVATGEWRERSGGYARSTAITTMSSACRWRCCWTCDPICSRCARPDPASSAFLPVFAVNIALLVQVTAARRRKTVR